LTNFIMSRLRKDDAKQRGWPQFMFGGRIRTSTFVLVIAFLAVWWVYDDHQQAAKSTNKTTQVPATQVVPPGFVPDPNYTWVPRSRLQTPPKTVTVTQTPTTTPPPTTTTTTTPPLIPPIVLPPPFGPPTTTTAPPPGQPPASPPLPGLP
jgi:hypothetical protein